MNCWELLGVAPNADASVIKKAFAERSRKAHPEDDPEGFVRLRDAYREAVAWRDHGGETAPVQALSTAARQGDVGVQRQPERVDTAAQSTDRERELMVAVPQERKHCLFARIHRAVNRDGDMVLPLTLLVLLVVFTVLYIVSGVIV